MLRISNSRKLPAILITAFAVAMVLACGNNDENSSTKEPEQEIVTTDASGVAPNRLIKLVDPLDDPDHYCVDIRGWGSNVRLTDSLQAHTCKPTDNRDEQFTYLSPSSQIYAEEYDLCLEPETLTDGSQIYLRQCIDTSQQSFSAIGDGTIRLGDTGESGLCLAVASGDGHVINAIHKRRELYVRACDATDSSLMTWEFASGAAGTGS